MLEPEARGAPAPEATPASKLLAFERLLAGLSARFVNLPASKIDGAIVDALRQFVSIIGVDRSGLLRLAATDGTVEITHSWAVDGVPPATPRSVTQEYPWAVRRLQAGLPVVVPRVDDLPPEAAVDQASWRRAGVKSNLTMPMSVAGRVEGALAFGCMRYERAWPDELVARVRVLADVFANALAHKRAQEALDAAVEFERTASDVLAALFGAGRVEQDWVIEAGLTDLARVFRAERATLWERLGDTALFKKTHRWVAEGVPVPPGSMSAVTTPWISTQIIAGAIVCFACHADLPAEAAGDLPGLQALGIRAGVMVPLAVSGAVVGALSFASVREDREWPAALVPRVKLLGEVFAGLLARQEAERREQEAQAQAAHAARVGTMGVFAASLVHELTQPLAAILANAETASELLAAHAPDLDELRAAVGDIVADDRRASELIQQLRLFLRRGEPERAELDLREVIDAVLRLVGNEAAGKGVEVTLDCAATLPKFVGDRVQLQQVLLNLLLNAVDALAACAPGRQRVALRVRATDVGASIEVSDTGPGMDEPTLARAFQPFFTTKPGGMGLGLSISRTIVVAHGGTLSATSTPGRGTTFRVELPARLPEAMRPAPPVAPAAAAGGTVFIIDDDPSMRRALERQLERAGYRVEVFASAQDYLLRQPHAGVACIVSDVRMPGLSGLDLQASLAQANRDLPMVFISGHGDVPTSVHAMRAGAVNFLAKPFTKGELFAAVAEALAQSRAREAARNESARLRTRYESLTRREREVFALVATGLLNKVIADRLGAAEKTIKIHRARVMEKMSADSVADLVRMAERLGLQQSRAVARD